MKTTTKPGHKLSFHDRISRLSFAQAAKMLGENGAKLIRAGGKMVVDPAEDIYLAGDLLRVTVRDAGACVNASLTLHPEYTDKLHFNCEACDTPCVHLGALFSTLLENKVILGLAVPPPERKALPEQDDAAIVEQALAERAERSNAEKMRIKTADDKNPWTDYAVTSMTSGKTYRVSLRGLEPGESFCSCPDFRTNTLGTCKHLMKVIKTVKRKFFEGQLNKSYRYKHIEIMLKYGHEIELIVRGPKAFPEAIEPIVRPLLEKPVADYAGLLRRLEKLEAAGAKYTMTPDAEEFLEQRLFERKVEGIVREIRQDPANHRLRTSLLKIDLLPYQLDGVAFAVGAGRAVLADDMGLGKTIQGVGTAELLARLAGIKRVLVVCPASLKSQWRNEIGRYCERSVQIVEGKNEERPRQYHGETFFTICNYEQVLRDIHSVETTAWDLIILDEGQRIKNWEAKTSRVIKGLRSRFALVLSGTPLENRLDELYSVVQFIDNRRLGPGFRFFHRHRMVDEKGKVLGYRNLEALRERLKPILLRRTRDSVKLDLPERAVEIVRIPPTDEQAIMHDGFLRIVASIVGKAYLTEMDVLRLRAALLSCRMTADASILVNKEPPNCSSKLERLNEILEAIAAEADRKVVLFSEWTSMLDLIEPLLNKHKLGFVRLDGSVPQKKRQLLVNEFQTSPECRFIIMTNAGAVGLNLQAANTVINVDLPWNPAVLEQRIGRAHRMGQTRQVQVFLLVTEGTIEESLLSTLAAKKELASAALDVDSDLDAVELSSNSDELKAKLEILLGAKPEAPVAELGKRAAIEATVEERRKRLSAAGGELMGAVFSFLGEVVPNGSAAEPDEKVVREIRSRLDEQIEVAEDGTSRLTFSFKDRSAIDGLALTLARILGVASSS